MAATSASLCMEGERVYGEREGGEEKEREREREKEREIWSNNLMFMLAVVVQF